MKTTTIKDNCSEKEGGGARKVALFLSTLDRKTAEVLLRNFDPQIAKEIIKEASLIKEEAISRENIELIIEEFVTSFSEDTSKFSNILLKGGEDTKKKGGEASSVCKKREVQDVNTEEERGTFLLGTLSADCFIRLAHEERSSTFFILFSRLSQRQVEKLRGGLSDKLFDTCEFLEGVRNEGHIRQSDAVKRITRLEETFFERVLEDE